MNTVKVTNVSVATTEKDLWDFFAFSGEIKGIQLQPAGDTKIAFVSFQDDKALDTALLLTGAQIGERTITVERSVGAAPSEHSVLVEPALDSTYSKTSTGPATTSGLNRAQQVVSNLLSRGYILGKDTMSSAKMFDEKHQLSRTAATKAVAFGTQARETAASIDRRIGLSQKFMSGTASVKESIRTLDDKYHVAEKTRGTLDVASEKVTEAKATILRSKFVAASSEWFSGAYSRFAKVAVEVTQKASGRASGGDIANGDHQDNEHDTNLPALSSVAIDMPSDGTGASTKQSDNNSGLKFQRIDSSGGLSLDEPKVLGEATSVMGTDTIASRETQEQV